MTQLYSLKKDEEKENLVNSALKYTLSSSYTSSRDLHSEDSCLQVQSLDIKKVSKPPSHETPMSAYISQTNLSVNNSKTNFLRYFPAAAKKLREQYGLTARWIVDFIDRLDHCQTIFGGSWAHTNKQWAEVLGCSVRTFKTVLKTAEKELKLVIVNRDCYKRKDGVYIKQYRYSLNPEGLESLKNVWFSRLKSKEIQINKTHTMPIATGKCKKSTNIIVKHKSKDLSKFNKKNEANFCNDLKEEKEFKPDKFVPDGIYYGLAEKKIGKYHNMIEEAQNFANYCVNAKKYKGKVFTQFEMNGLFVNWWLKRREKYIYEHNPLRLIPYAKRVKYNQNLMNRPVMQKQTYYEPEIIEKDTTARVFYQGAMISMDEYNQLLYKPRHIISPEQDAEHDKMISEMLKVRGIRS